MFYINGQPANSTPVIAPNTAHLEEKIKAQEEALELLLLDNLTNNNNL